MNRTLRKAQQSNKRAVGYVRRSTDRQEQSIPDQKKAIEAYVAEQNLSFIKYYIDDAISGTSTVARKAFQQMINDAQPRNCRFDLIVVYDVKRFGRVDNDEAGYYRHLLRTNGVDVHYVSENFNGDATDDLLRPVKQWQARQESKDLSKVTIRGLLSKMPGGWWMGGVPPFGYDLRYEDANGKFLFILRYISDGTKQMLGKKGKLNRKLARGESLSISKRDRAKLVPSLPERVKIIRRIFKMYANHGKGFKAVADTLNREGIPAARCPKWHPTYSGKWTATTIRALLVNRLYTGDMVWNRRTDAKFHSISGGKSVDRPPTSTRRLELNDESDWLIVRDAHPPLISRRFFEQARKAREARPTSTTQRGRRPLLLGRRSKFILSGLLECAQCGNRFQGYTRLAKYRKDGSPVRVLSYACGGYITKGASVCQLNPIPKKILEKTVIEAVIDFYKPYLAKDGEKRVEKLIAQQTGQSVKNIASERKRLEAKQAKLKKTINNLLDNLTETNRKLIDKRLEELNKKYEKLTIEIERLDLEAISQSEMTELVDETYRFISHLEVTLRNDSPEEKRTALRQCIQQIKIDAPNKKLKIAVNTIPSANSLLAATHLLYKKIHGY